MLVIFTDGFVEAVDSAGRRFGEKSFEKIVFENQEKNPEQLIESIYDEVYTFSEGTPQQDDMTIMVIKNTEV